MRKNKLHIVIECNGTPIEKLKEYLQYVVLPNIVTGNEKDTIKIEGHIGCWSAYYRPLKNEYIQKELVDEAVKILETKKPETVTEFPKKKIKKKVGLAQEFTS